MDKAKMTAKTTMKLAILGSAALLLGACAGEKAEDVSEAEAVDIETSAPDVAFEKGSESYDGTVAKPGSPFRISYRLIGTPVVGSPVTVDLNVESLHGPRPVNLDYRINDASSMVLGEAQPASVSMEPAANESAYKQQVTVIPQREGRFYLNVSASFETENGTMSSIIAIPVQVGEGSREMQPHGEVELDENGEAVRVLSDDG